MCGAGNGELNAVPEHANLEELVGLSPRSTISDDYLAGASPQMSEDEDAAESIETPPDNMPESSRPSSLVSKALWTCRSLPSSLRLFLDVEVPAVTPNGGHAWQCCFLVLNFLMRAPASSVWVIVQACSMILPAMAAAFHTSELPVICVKYGPWMLKQASSMHRRS